MVAKAGGSKPKRAKGTIRGVSRAKYLVLSRMVRAKETTWEELERKGVVLPPKRESEFRRHVKATIRQ